MVQYTHIHECQRLFQRYGQRLIRPARFGNTGRMVMGKNDRSGIEVQCALHHLPRINAGLGQGAAKQFFRRHHTVLGIEEDCDEHLMRPGVQQQAQRVRDEAVAGPKGTCFDRG